MKRFFVSVTIVVVGLIVLTFLSNGSDVVRFVYRVF